jgi:hypothetical protein
MKLRVAVAIALTLGGPTWAQTHSDAKPGAVAAAPAACGLDRSDMQDELKEMSVYTSRMESRILMLRNSAGVIQNLQLRNALQIDAEMWQDELDQLKKHMSRMQAAVDRCDARERIKANDK